MAHADLQQTSDIALYDLQNDPGELQNIANADHPQYDEALLQVLLDKLNALIVQELGEDRAPFDLDMFGTRKVRYKKADQAQD